MPASNKPCYLCGARKPAWKGEDSSAGRGVPIWVCADCARDPEMGLNTRREAQAKAAARGKEANQ